MVARVSEWVVGHLLSPQVKNLLGLGDEVVFRRVGDLEDLEAAEADDTEGLWL